MNGAVVFIIGLIAGIIGGVVVSLIVDEVNLNRVLEEFKNYHTGYYKNICKELNECLEKMEDNHAIDIADLHNDIEKTIWLDDLTIKNLNDQIETLNKKVDDHFRWSLGVWNDISVLISDSNLVNAANDLKDFVHEKVEEMDNPSPIGPDGSRWFQDADKQGWTEENIDA